ncbi:MAG TPA: glycosyltransferase family 39 protein [Xanthobacteraceae bacterium]|jgi:4-amino-4-deoxy-L-arabinose transferase-like glycosyltransferase
MSTTVHDEGKSPAASSGNVAVSIDFVARSHARACLILVAAVLLAVLPGFFTIPPIDRDEARFAQATKQMLETGDYIDIRFQEDVRYKKPVGIYWLQAASVKAGSALGIPNAATTIWLYRIPSLAGAIGAVLLTYWTALAFVSRRAAVLAGLMMASCVLLSFEGRIAKTDAVLLLTAVAVMGALARVYLPEQRKRLDVQLRWTIPAVFWTALAAGVLLKGPVILMFVVLGAGTLVAVDRSARWLVSLRPLPGLIWFSVLVLPWFIAITWRSGDRFFAESVGHDLFAKLLHGEESHGAPPGFYFALFWVTFWPAAPLAALAAPAAWAARREPGAKFLLAWVLPSWIALELVITKLPHYVLPLYPAIAILLAGIIDADVLSRRRLVVNATAGWFLIPVAAGMAGLFALLFVGHQFGLLVWPALAASLVLGLLAWQLYEADGAMLSVLRAIGASVLLLGALLGLIVPALSTLFPSAMLADITRESGCRQPLAASAGFEEPSLVFLVGTSTRLTDGAGAAEFLRGGDCRFAFIEARHERSFADRAEAINLRYSLVTRIEGFNVGNPRPIAIAVYRSGGPQ